MSVTSTELLRFILALLGDSGKADEFMANPADALASAGLSGLSCADVDAITPVLANAAQGIIPAAAADAAPAEMVRSLVTNLQVSNFDNSGIIQNVWSAGELRQAFASDGGFAFGGDLQAKAPVVTGDGNTIATDTAQASGRDTIQNQGDGNLALGGNQSIAQDSGILAGGDAFAGGDKVGGNNNEAADTGNNHSVTVGGNKNEAADSGNNHSVTVGGNKNEAVNTGNSTVTSTTTSTSTTTNTSDNHSVTVGGNKNEAVNTGNATSTTTNLTDDHSVTVGGNQNNGENSGSSVEVSVGDLTLVNDESVTVGGNQNNSENTGNSVDLSFGDIALDVTAIDDDSVYTGGDYWAEGSNTGGIGNVDVRNSGNTADSGNTVALTENNDNSITVGHLAVDLSEDNSITTRDVVFDNSTTTVSEDTTITNLDQSINAEVTVSDINVDQSIDNSIYVSDIAVDVALDQSEQTYVDASTTEGDTYVDASSTTGDTYVDASSSYGDYYETGSGNTIEVVAEVQASYSSDHNYSFGE